MIFNKSPLIIVLFWLQTVLDRCVTNVGNPHKKDYYVSQHTFVLWKLDLYDVATVLDPQFSSNFIGLFYLFPD